MTRGALARLAPAALVLPALALLSGCLVGADLLHGRDLVSHFYPRLVLIAEGLARGEVPRWNPWGDHGVSLFGPRAGGVLYPANLLFVALPPGPAMAWFVALHLALATEGARRLLRPAPGGAGPGGAATVSAAAAAAGGLCYGLGGFAVSMHANVVYLVSAAWLPWACAGGRLLAAAPLRGLALAGSAVGLCLVAGEPQGALAAAGLAVALALRRASAGRRARVALYAGMAVVLGVAAGALQVLSLLDEVDRTNRAWPGFRDPYFGLAPLALLVELVLPGLPGDRAQAEGGLWALRLWGGDPQPWCGLSVGVFGLCAALAALAARDGEPRGLGLRRLDPRTWGLRGEAAALALLGVLLTAFEAGSSLGIRFPSKWLVVTALGLALLAGLGVDRLARSPGRLAARWLWVVLALSLPAGLAVLAAVALGRGPDLDAWLTAQRAVGSEARVAATWSLLRAAGVAGLALLLLSARARLGARAFRVLALGLVALDLVSLARPSVERTRLPLLAEPALAGAVRAGAGGPRGAPARFESQTALVHHRALPPQGGLCFDEVRALLHHAALAPNAGYLAHVRVVDAFESVRDLPYHALTRAPEAIRLPATRRAALIDAEQFLVSREDLGALGAERADLTVLRAATTLGGAPDLLLVRNLACPPWAYLTPAADGSEHPGELVERVTDPRRDARTRVVLGPEGAAAAADVAGVTSGASATPGGVTVVHFEAERIVLRTRSERPAWLVVREAFSPDWTATLDGVEVETARADLLYRAVAVPAGSHEVAFAYDPWWWGPGVRATALAWVLLAAAWVAAAARRTATPPPPG